MGSPVWASARVAFTDTVRTLFIIFIICPLAQTATVAAAIRRIIRFITQSIFCSRCKIAAARNAVQIRHREPDILGHEHDIGAFELCFG